MLFVLGIIYIVLLVLWAVSGVPNGPLGVRGPFVNSWVAFILFAILGWVVFAGVLARG